MYKIVGGDNKEYGPVTEEKVREWITQGRANGNTMLSFEGGPWRPASSFPEFADALRTAAPPPLAGQQPGYAAAGAGYPVAERNNAAIAGLVLSIFSFACCCGVPLPSVLGIVFSMIGLSQIKKEPTRYTTTATIAWLGIIIGILGLVASGIFYATGGMAEVLEEIQRRQNL